MEEIDIQKILDMFEDDLVIPASKMERPQSALDREMFEDANKRFNQADGGRIPFAKAKSVQKKPEPAKYVTGNELFEDLPISKKDYFRLKYKGGSLLTNTIDKLLKPKKITVPGRPDEIGFKEPTKEQKETFQKISSRKGQLKPRTIDLMLEFDKKFSNKYAKGQLPDLKTVQKFFPDVTPTTAGNVTVRLSQWYNGTDFLNPELQSIKRNKTKAKNIQKASSTTRYGNFYSDQAYKLALDTIDEKIGRRTGTFKEFKDNIKNALKEAGLPIYSKDSPFGFNLNEISGVTGAARTKTAAFSDFVDVAEGNFNQKQLSRFQKDFAELREKLDKLNLSNNSQNKTKAQSLINDFQKVIKYYEGETGSELPKIGLGTADQYYSSERLESIAKPKKVGETGKKMFRNIPGTDLIKTSKDAGYTVIIPENYRTVGEIMETGTRDVLKKNVQNTLDGMKEFFNEYDEKKLFKKLQDASPPILRQMMKAIPKVASLEDDFLNAYGYPLTAGLDSSIGVKKEDKTFAEKNPLTTQTGLTSAGTAAVLKATDTPIKEALGRFSKGAFSPLGLGVLNVGLGVDPTQSIDRLGLGLEGIFLKDAVKGSIGATKGMKNRALQKAIQRILNAGMSVPTALRVARVANPVGIATLAGEGLYQLGKRGYDQYQQMQGMTQREKIDFLADQYEDLGGVFGEGA
tara:strand:+ start:49 stop:2109 length:2061 start_codon:yes stop_codon:yes gene_type:complete